MSSKVSLVNYVPGVIVSIEFPLAIEGDAFPDIDFRATLKDLIRKAEDAKRLVKLSADETKEDVGPPLVQPHLPRRTNPYDNIIERLERKYTAHRIIDDDDDDLNVTNETNESITNGSSEVDGTDAAANKSAKRSKASSCDAYDLEDPFIDDEGDVAEINMELKKKKIKTVHDGFFVSAGKLEVTLRDRVPHKGKSSKRMAAGDSVNKLTSGDHDDGNGEKEVTVVSKSKLQLKRSRSDDSEGLGEGEGDDNGHDNDLDDVDVDGLIAESEATQSKRIKTSNKPMWKPTAAVLAAIEVFKEVLATSGVKIGKHFLPPALDDDFRKLDRVVQSEMRNSLPKTSGYLETLVEVLGHKLTPGKIKYALKRLQLRDIAAEAKQAMEEAVSQSIADINSHMAPLDPPAPAPPLTITDANIVTSTMSNTTTSLPLTTSTTTSTDTGTDTAATTSSEPPTAATQAIVPATLAAGLTFASMMPSLIVVEKDAAAAAKSLAASVPPESTTTTNAESETVADTAVDSTSTSTSTQVVPFQWQCRWDQPMKMRLVHAEALTIEWAAAESSYRAMLTNVDKRNLKEEEYEPVSERDAVIALLKRILAAFPPLTIRGEIGHLRKIIYYEKLRVKKKKALEAEAKAAAAAATQSQAGVITQSGQSAAQGSEPSISTDDTKGGPTASTAAATSAMATKDKPDGITTGTATPKAATGTTTSPAPSLSATSSSASKAVTHKKHSSKPKEAKARSVSVGSATATSKSSAPTSNSISSSSSSSSSGEKRKHTSKKSKDGSGGGKVHKSDGGGGGGGTVVVVKPKPTTAATAASSSSSSNKAAPSSKGITLGSNVTSGSTNASTSLPGDKTATTPAVKAAGANDGGVGGVVSTTSSSTVKETSSGSSSSITEHDDKSRPPKSSHFTKIPQFSPQDFSLPPTKSSTNTDSTNTNTNTVTGAIASPDGVGLVISSPSVKAKKVPILSPLSNSIRSPTAPATGTGTATSNSSTIAAAGSGTNMTPGKTSATTSNSTSNPTATSSTKKKRKIATTDPNLTSTSTSTSSTNPDPVIVYTIDDE